MIMKKLLFTICALLAVGSTFATNTFSINTVYASTSGISTIEVNYSLDAGFACGGFSFDLQLPDEFEFVGKNAYTPGDCYASTPTFTTNLTAAGVLKIAYATSDPLTKQSGTLASFQIRAKSSAVAGNTYTGGSLTAAKFVDNSTSASANAADVPFNIVATDRVVLDENAGVLPTPQDGVDVLVKRTIKKEVWNTICLPFGMDAANIESIFGTGTQMAKYNTFAKGSDGSFTMNFVSYDWESEDWMDANTPYIIKPTQNVAEFTVDAVEVSDDYSTLVNSKSVKGKKSSFTGTLSAGYVLPENYLFISSGQFYYSTGSTSIKGFRGYFYLQEFNPSSSSAPVFVVDGEATNIDGLQIVNGDGRIYNLNGQHVENPTKKGVYIQNGKKVVIKK